MIVLEFVGGKRMVIDQERVMQFRQTLDHLYLTIKAFTSRKCRSSIYTPDLVPHFQHPIRHH